MKHYIVIFTTVFDYEESRTIHSCKDLKTAQKFYSEHLKEARKIAYENEWEVETNNATLYEANEDGYYARNHVTLEIVEVEMV